MYGVRMDEVSPSSAEPRFELEFERSTGEVMFDAIYPSGCHHRTSMDRGTLLDLIASARKAWTKSAA